MQMARSECEQLAVTTAEWFYLSGPYVLCCAVLLAYALCLDNQRCDRASQSRALRLTLIWALCCAAAGAANYYCLYGILSACCWAGVADPTVARAVAVMWHLMMLGGAVCVGHVDDDVNSKAVSPLAIWALVPPTLLMVAFFIAVVTITVLTLSDVVPSGLVAQIIGSIAFAVLIAAAARRWRAARGYLPVAADDVKTGDAK